VDRRAPHQQPLRLTDLCAHIAVLGASRRSGLHTRDFARRRRIVARWIDRVLISHDAIEIRSAIPRKGLGHTGPLRLPYRTHAQWDEPVSPAPHPLGKAGQHLYRYAAPGLRTPHLASYRATEIGSKSPHERWQGFAPFGSYPSPYDQEFRYHQDG
jgi:hypothetical protein